MCFARSHKHRLNKSIDKIIELPKSRIWTNTVKENMFIVDEMLSMIFRRLNAFD